MNPTSLPFHETFACTPDGYPIPVSERGIGEVISGPAPSFVRFYSGNPNSDVADNPVRNIDHVLKDALIYDTLYTSRSAASMPELMPDQADGHTFAFQFMRMQSVPLSTTFGLKALCDSIGLRRNAAVSESPIYMIGIGVKPTQQQLLVTLANEQVVIVARDNVIILSPDMKQVFPKPAEPDPKAVEFNARKAAAQATIGSP